jgi:hypothetical protein
MSELLELNAAMPLNTPAYSAESDGHLLLTELSIQDLELSIGYSLPVF